MAKTNGAEAQQSHPMVVSNLEQMEPCPASRKISRGAYEKELAQFHVKLVQLQDWVRAERKKSASSSKGATGQERVAQGAGGGTRCSSPKRGFRSISSLRHLPGSRPARALSRSKEATLWGRRLSGCFLALAKTEGSSPAATVSAAWPRLRLEPKGFSSQPHPNLSLPKPANLFSGFSLPCHAQEGRWSRHLSPFAMAHSPASPQDWRGNSTVSGLTEKSHEGRSSLVRRSYKV
jgi:hypothetical protein